MAIPVACPHCEHDFEIPDEFAGIKGKCPRCGEAFRAPKTSPPPPPAEPGDENVEAELPAEIDAGESPIEPPPEEPASDSSNDESPSDSIADEPAFDPSKAAPPDADDQNIEPMAPPISKPRTPVSPRTIGIPAPILAVCLIVLFVLLAGGAAVAWWSNQYGWEGLFATQTDPSIEEKDDVAEVSTDGVDSPGVGSLAKIDEKTRRQVAKVYRPGVVQLTATKAGSLREFTQTGWVVDRRRGLIATSYLPLDRIATVRVTIQDDDEPGGTREIEAAGVVAENKAADFSLLQVSDATLPVELAISSETELLTDLPLLVGSAESDAWQTIWSRGLLQISSTGEPFLLAHTGRMAAAPAGSPLVNAAGEVVACNTLFDPEPNGQGRAIAAIWVRQAIAGLSADPTVNRFVGEEMVAVAVPAGATGGDDPKTDRPVSPPKSVATPEMTASQLVKAIDEAKVLVEEFNWIPKDAKQYESLQQLTRLVNSGKRMEDDRRKSDSDRISAGSAAQQVLVDMSREPWPDDTNLALINHLAMNERNEEDAGFFAYGYFLQWMEEKIDDRNVALLQLIGSESFVAVPVIVEKSAIPPRSQWRLIGEVRSDKTVPISAADGAGGFRDIEAPVIESKYIIGRPE